MSESNPTPLHPSIVALVSLAANIAANHPKQGLCQVDKLKEYGDSGVAVPPPQAGLGSHAA